MRRKLKREQEIEKNKRDDKILIPMLIGTAILVVTVVIGIFIPITLNSYLLKIIIGLTLLIMASSGYWQIKYKYIHGFPPITGVWAIIFSIIWIIALVVIAISFVFFN